MIEQIYIQMCHIRIWKNSVHDRIFFIRGIKRSKVLEHWQGRWYFRENYNYFTFYVCRALIGHYY